MNNGQLVCYEPQKLNKHGHNYCTRDLELTVTIDALKMWRHYHFGRKFILMSDHNGLRYSFDHAKMNARQARWLAMISEFDFKIKYIKVKHNKVENALSEQIHVHHLEIMSSYGKDIHYMILQACQHYVNYMDIVHKLQQDDGIYTCTGTGGSTGKGIGVDAQGMYYFLTTDGLVKF